MRAAPCPIPSGLTLGIFVVEEAARDAGEAAAAAHLDRLAAEEQTLIAAASSLDHEARPVFPS